jgi:hypothetical protein
MLGETETIKAELAHKRDAVSCAALLHRFGEDRL